jgi:hypothetical protein
VAQEALLVVVIFRFPFGPVPNLHRKRGRTRPRLAS